jgi:outer membrane receptor protein involved in Fe transport
MGLRVRRALGGRVPLGRRPLQGDVEAYTTADIRGNYYFTERIGVGVNVANLFDNEHWESFGGDLLGSARS